MEAFPVAIDSGQLDACLKAARVGDSAAWRALLAQPVSRVILDHAGVGAEELASSMERHLRGDPFPEGMIGYLAMKAIRTGQPGFADFVGVTRRVLDGLVAEAASAASIYLPKPWPDHVTIRLVGFAFADAFSQGDPVINLGDFYFGIHQKMTGDEAVRTRKTLGLLRRVIAHELHHAVLGKLLRFPPTQDSEWLLKVLMSEGVATLLLLPFTEDDGYYFTNWRRHAGRMGEYLAELPGAVAASRERVPDNVMQRWVANVGACYYVGATMAQAIDDAFGRARLLGTLADPRSFLSAYDAAATARGLPRLKWPMSTLTSR